MSSVPASQRDARRNAAARLRGAVALARNRLRRTTGVRLGVIAAAATAAGFALVGFALRAGGTTSLVSLVASGAQAVAWVGGAPVALAVAHDRASVDRRDGVDVLAAVHGVAPSAFEAARAAAAVAQALVAIAFPALVLALALVPVPPSRGGMLGHVAAIGAVAVFGLVTAVTVGGVSTACGRIGRRRGRLLLGLVVLGPWALADLVGHPSWSIPGALDAVMTTSMQAFVGTGGFG